MPTGSPLVASLVKKMAANQPQLKKVQAHCPSGPIKHYPLACHFTASEVLPGSTKAIKVAGTITVTGLISGSYEYGLNYGPAH